MSGPVRVRGSYPASRPAYVLFGLMTLLSFGGPFLIAAILWGGERSGWPPDRPIEWIGVGLILFLFLACFTACLTTPFWLSKSRRARPADPTPPDAPPR